jgi:hypothetical protein
MLLFADYEGFDVGWSLIFWGILTASALILGLLGLVADSFRRTVCAAVGLGLTACLIELLGVAAVWICIYAEPANPRTWAKLYWPGHRFWGLSILTLVLGSLAFGLGVRRLRSLTAKKSGGGEL